MQTLSRSCVEMLSIEEGERAFRLAGEWAALLSSGQEDDRALAMLWLMRRLATFGVYFPCAVEVDGLADQVLVEGAQQ